MKSHRCLPARLCWPATAIVLMALFFSSLLGACGGPTPTPQVLIITATYTPASAVRVVTATFTPTAAVVPTVTSSPLSQPSTSPDQLPTEQAAATVAAPAATEPPPATETSSPEPAATYTPKPAAQSPSLKSYFVVYTAYQGPDLQDYRLWAMNGDGSGASEILTLASEPAFSADGDKFAFYHWTDGLYIFDLQKETLSHFVHDGNASFPTWAPNGQRLTYFVAAGQRWIYVVNSDGSGVRQLTPGLRPSWSLQGGFIGYDTCENNRCGIFRINPDGGGKQQLTSDGGGGAAVSPNGKKIAYWSQADGDFEVYVINADGSGGKQLTENSGNDALPTWSPDGKYIYYLSDQNGKGWAVMVMGADGSNPRKIVTTNAGSDPARGWQYQRIAVTWND